MSSEPTVTQSTPEPDARDGNGQPRADAELERDDLITDQAVDKVEDDSLDYMAFVRQFARLAADAECPVNIALFGPWGSGKSTVGNLLKTEIETIAESRGRSMPFVRYDAWRFAGLSLQRSFISEAAEGLGIRRERYHRSLYQDRRTGSFRLRTLLRSLPAGLFTFLLALAAIILLALGLAALAAVVADKDVGDELQRQAPTLLPVAGLIAIFTAIARPFIDAAGIQISEGAPVAAEQFRVTFTRLIKDGLKRERRLSLRLGRWDMRLWPRRALQLGSDRVVFFIDELDRCAPEDVVEALRALKTFLEVPGCVFVVAADRDVIEAALDRLPQSTPLNEEAPYFSSASSFLDKVFQYQISLPPLRGGRRLRGYARELVSRREGGLWSEIQSDNDGRLLDDIVHTLIPSHVRSPRRVKVLLNRFAANARIAAAHQIAWMERAEEIAKLTVLQTEFPAVAADLRREPRLPELLLRPPRDPSPSLAEMLERHDVGAGRDSGEIGSGAQVTGRLLAGAGRARMVHVQRGELRRYLEHTATVPHVRRDLLFLETGGNRLGLAEAQLMDVVETDAPMAPEKVAASVECLESDAQRRLVAEVLLDMSEMAVGREKRNIITALLETADGLNDEASQVADRVVTAVQIFRDNYDLPSELLAPALRISELQQSRFRVNLTEALLGEGGLWSEYERVLTVLAAAETLQRAGLLDKVERQIERTVRRWPEIVAEAIAGRPEGNGTAAITPMPWDGVEALLGLEHVACALDDAIAARPEREAHTLVEDLYDSGTRSLDEGAVSVTAVPMLANLRSPLVYGLVRTRSERLEAHPGGPQGRCSQSLAAMRHPAAEPRDWGHWGRGITQLDAIEPREARWAVDAITAVLERFRPGVKIAYQQKAAALIPALAELAEGAFDQRTRDGLSEAARQALRREWWNGPQKRQTHRRLHEALRALAGAVPEPLASTLWRLLEDDLCETVREAGGQTPELLVGQLGAELPPAHAASVARELEAVAARLAFDADWADRIERWLLDLAKIGADEPAVKALAEPASIARLRAAITRDEFAPVAARLEPLLLQPADPSVVLQIAVVVAEGFASAGERFSRELLQSLAIGRREELVAAVGEAAAMFATGEAELLRTIVVQATGTSLLADSPGIVASTGLRVATPHDLVSERLTADVVVVGSGAAGGILADRLARAGRRVLVLERGRLIDPALVRDRATLVREALGDTRREGDLDVLQAQCVGGGTLIGDGIATPLPPRVLDDWHELTGFIKELGVDGAFAQLAEELDLRTPHPVTGSRGLTSELIRRSTDDAPERLSGLATLLPSAQSLGSVDVLSDCRVEALEMSGERVRGVRCRLLDQRPLTVEAATVVLAAGAIQSSAILRRSDLGGPSVGADLHFNLTVLLLAEYVSDEHRDQVRYHESLRDGYVSLTRAADARGTVAGMPGWFEDVAQGRHGTGRWTVTSVTVPANAAGSVSVATGSRARAGVAFKPRNVEALIKAIGHASAQAFARGARRVRPATHRPLDLRESTLDELRRLIGPEDLMLTSGQPLGGNPLGPRERGGVVDDSFRVYGTENLFVCDASVMPTATIVYPQLTIMALADRAARRITDPEPPRVGRRRFQKVRSDEGDV